MFFIKPTIMNSITQWLIGIHKRLSFLVCGKIFKRGEIDLSKERITFSASNKAMTSINFTPKAKSNIVGCSLLFAIS